MSNRNLAAFAVGPGCQVMFFSLRAILGWSSFGFLVKFVQRISALSVDNLYYITETHELLLGKRLRPMAWRRDWECCYAWPKLGVRWVLFLKVLSRSGWRQSWMSFVTKKKVGIEDQFSLLAGGKIGQE